MVFYNIIVFRNKVIEKNKCLKNKLKDLIIVLKSVMLFLFLFFYKVNCNDILVFFF